MRKLKIALDLKTEIKDDKCRFTNQILTLRLKFYFIEYNSCFMDINITNYNKKDRFQGNLDGGFIIKIITKSTLNAGIFFVYSY